MKCGGEPGGSATSDTSAHAADPGREASSRVASRWSDCALWGVLNVTPDSFSDGGRFLDLDAALAQGRALWAAGASVVDVGGESTRPRGATYGAGYAAVSADEERARVVPVVVALARGGARVSIDTTKGEVARAALEAGATIVNDVSCGRDPALLRVAAEAEADLVLMHNRGRGEVTPEAACYADLVGEVLAELAEACARAEQAGVKRARVWLDPGLGFAKTPAQSLLLLARVDALVATGRPVLVGASRKSFLAEAAPDADGARPAPGDRLAAGIAAAVHAARAGARALRVHDVREVRQALLLAEALR